MLRLHSNNPVRIQLTRTIKPHAYARLCIYIYIRTTYTISQTRTRTQLTCAYAGDVKLVARLLKLLDRKKALVDHLKDMNVAISKLKLQVCR